MAGLGSLTVSLEANIAKFNSDMNRASSQTERAMKQMQRSADATRDAMTGLAKGFVLGASIAAFTNALKGALDSLDQVAKRAQAVGLSAKALQEIGYAATFSGVGAEQLDQGLIKLSNTIAEAAAGGEKSAATFKAIGVNIKDASGAIRPTDAILKDIAERFSGFRDGAAKTALAVDLFGKSGAKLIALLNGGRIGIEEFAKEAAKLGIIMGDDATAAAEKFNDQMDRLNLQWDAVRQGIAADAVPAISRLIEQFEAARRSGLGWVDSLQTMFGKLRMLGSPAQIVAEAVRGMLGSTSIDAKDSQIANAQRQLDKYRADLAAMDGPNATDNPTLRGNITAGLKQKIAETSAILAALSAQRDALAKDLGGRGDPRLFVGDGSKPDAPTIKTGKSDAEKAAEKAAADYKKQQESIDSVTNSMRGQLLEVQALYGSEEKLTQVQKLRIDLQLNKYPGIKAGQVEEMERIAILTDLQGDLNKKLLDVAAAAKKQMEASDGMAKSMEEWMRGLDASNTLLQLEVDMMGLSEAEIIKLTAARRIQLELEERLAQAKRNGIILSEEQIEQWKKEAKAAAKRFATIIDEGQAKSNDPWKAAQESIQRYTEKANDSAGQIQRVLETAFQGAEDAFVKFAMTGKLSFSDMARSIMADLVRIQAQKAVAGIVNAAVNLFSGSPLGSVLGMGGAGVPTANALPSFDVGTDFVPRDMVAKIHKGERIVPAAQNRDGGSGPNVTVYQNFTVGDVATVSMVRDAVAGSERRIGGALSRSMRYGGAMS